MLRKTIFSFFLAFVMVVTATIAIAQQDPAALKAELKSINTQIATTNKAIKKAKGAKKKNLQTQLQTLQSQKAEMETLLKAGATGTTTTKAVVEDKEVVKSYPYDSTDYQVQSGYNPLSVLPVHISDIMLRTKIIRRIDFREKCNSNFRFRGAEFWKYVCEAYRMGQLEAFTDDSLNKVKNPKFVLQKLMTVERDENGKITDTRPQDNQNFYLAEIKEDLLFDRQRSQTFYDIQSVGLILPAQYSEKNATEPICFFRYKDIERVLNANPLAKWRNSYNTIEDRRYSDGFRLRLFCSRIIKMSKDNPINEEISALPKYEKFGVKGWLLASQQFEYDLVSQENELYDY